MENSTIDSTNFLSCTEVVGWSLSAADLEIVLPVISIVNEAGLEFWTQVDKDASRGVDKIIFFGIRRKPGGRFGAFVKNSDPGSIVGFKISWSYYKKNFPETPESDRAIVTSWSEDSVRKFADKIRGLPKYRSAMALKLSK